jgi:hypothetical protein
MKHFRTYITELFEKPFPLHKITKVGGVGRGTFISYLYTINPNLKPMENNIISVEFSLDRDASDTDWLLEFSRGGAIHITNQGNASRVFASVLHAVQDFITKHKPNTISFSALKGDDDIGSRVRLYTTLIKRFAPQIGYELIKRVGYNDESDHEVLFVLARKTE